MKTGNIILAALLVSLIFLAAYIFTFSQHSVGILAGILVVKLLTGFFILKFRSKDEDIEFRQIFLMSFFTQIFSYIFILIFSTVMTFIALSEAGAPDTISFVTGINAMGMSITGFIVLVSVVPLVFSGIMYGVDKIISPVSKTDGLR